MTDSESKHDRRLQIGVAGVAAVAGLVGAGIGGYTSYVVAGQQIEAQRRQAETESVRSLRNAAYTTQARQAQVLRTVAGQVPDALARYQRREPGSRDALIALLGRFTDEYLRVSQDRELVRIAGSNDANAALARVNGANLRLRTTLASLDLPGSPLEPPETGPREITPQEIRADILRIDLANAAYIEVVRADVGTG